MGSLSLPVTRGQKLYSTDLISSPISPLALWTPTIRSWRSRCWVPIYSAGQARGRYRLPPPTNCHSAQENGTCQDTVLLGKWLAGGAWRQFWRTMPDLLSPLRAEHPPRSLIGRVHSISTVRRMLVERGQTVSLERKHNWIVAGRVIPRPRHRIPNL